MSLREAVARAIYGAAFYPQNDDEASRRKPSPGWCWDRTSPQCRQFAFQQADAAIHVMQEKRL